MWRHRIMGVIAALGWLTAMGCRRNPPPATPFSRASVIGQLASSYAGVSLPSDETPPNVLAYEELVYAHTPAGDLALDLYLPSLPEPPTGSAISPAPVAIVVHGGGWERGDRRMERPFAKQLAARGIAAATVSYRLGDAGRFPNALFDLESAVRWLRANAGRFLIDAARIGAVGGSAGGQLVALLGVSPGVPALTAGSGEGGGQLKADVQAVVDIDGLADFTGAALLAKEAENPGAPTRFLGGSFAAHPDVWRLASPITHAGPHSAPTLFIDSAATSGPPRQGVPILPGRAEMRDRLRAAGVASDLIVIPQTPHPFWLVNPWFDLVVDKTAAFFNQHLKGAR
jgi:pectinesterase